MLSPPSSSSCEAGTLSRANVHANDLAPSVSNYEEQTLTDHPNIDLAGPDSHNNETVTAAVEPDSIKAQAVNMTENNMTQEVSMSEELSIVEPTFVTEQPTPVIEQANTKQGFQGVPLHSDQQKQDRRGANFSLFDYSRDARRKRKLEAAQSDPDQTAITDFFFVIDEIDRLTNDNKKLLDMLRLRDTSDSQSTLQSCTPILRQIVANAERNVSRLPHGRRHSEMLKKFATSLFIYARSLAYDFLQKNLSQVMPSLRSVQRIVHSEYKTINEGQFRFDELAEYIDLHNAPRLISVGEDATRVISRVEYDHETDRWRWFCTTS